MTPYKSITKKIFEAQEGNRSLDTKETMLVLISLKKISQEKILLDNIINYVAHLEKGATPFEHLTAREFQIFKLIGCNFSSEDISEKLSISKNTVTTHRKNIIKKLKLTGTRNLQSIAVRYTENVLKK